MHNKTFRYKGVTVPFGELIHFASMKGKKYSEANVRLMIVGRAPYGWSKCDCTSEDTFWNSIQETLHDDFEWVVEKDGILYSRDNLDYSLYRGCSIWKVGKKIWEKLSDTKLNIEEKWVDYICWSNLFKIAPDNSNPTKMMKNAQFETCCDLLIRKIEEYKPTHILFATGYEYWFYDKQNDFSKLFELADKSVDDIVERKGIYVCETGVRIPVLVTQRPDSRKKGMTVKKYCNSVVDNFKNV